MCNVNSSSIEEMVFCQPVSLNGGSCRKCSSQVPQVILHGKDLYCNSCFLVYFIHKFRSTIGKSKQIKHNEKVLICISGGISSLALAHLIREGLDEKNHKRLRIKPTYLYIDKSCFNGSSLVSDKNYPITEELMKICTFIKGLQFDIFVVPFQFSIADEVFSISFEHIEEALIDKKEPVISTSLFIPASYEEKFAFYTSSLQSLYKSCRSQSAREDLDQELLVALLCKSASKLSMQKILLGDNGTRNAIRILTCIGLGRGSQLPDNVQFKAERFGIEVYRPMRELLIEEVQHYCTINDILPLEAPADSAIADNSIMTCTSNFLLGLQKDYPATIPTILKTGNKLSSSVCDDLSSCITSSTYQSSLSSPDNITNIRFMERESCESSVDFNDLNDSLCALCGSTLDTLQTQSSALYATFISGHFSQQQPPHQHLEPTIFSSCSSATDKNVKEQINTNEINLECPLDEHYLRVLCYGCRSIFRDLSDKERLPSNVKMAALQLSPQFVSTIHSSIT